MVVLNLKDVCKTEIYVLQDVTDTATVLHLRDTCNIVSGLQNGIILALRALTRERAATPMPARSNSSAGHDTHDLRILPASSERLCSRYPSQIAGA